MPSAAEGLPFARKQQSPGKRSSLSMLSPAMIFLKPKKNALGCGGWRREYMHVQKESRNVESTSRTVYSLIPTINFHRIALDSVPIDYSTVNLLELYNTVHGAYHGVPQFNKSILNDWSTLRAWRWGQKRVFECVLVKAILRNPVVVTRLRILLMQLTNGPWHICPILGTG